MAHILPSQLKTSNLLPARSRFYQDINSMVFRHINGRCTNYLNEVFEIASNTSITITLRNIFPKLKKPFREKLLDKIHSPTLVLHCEIKS